MKINEIIFEAGSDVEHKLRYRRGKQLVADRANSFGFHKGKGLVYYDANGRPQNISKVIDAVKLKGGTALIRYESSLNKFNKKFVSNSFFKWFTILIDPTVEWIESCAGINALYEAGAFPPKTAKQEANDAMAYYTHIWLSRMATGYPAWLASVVASKAAMAATVKMLSKFGIWGKIIALPVGLLTQVGVTSALQSETAQKYIIEKLGYFGWQAADLGAEWLGPLIPKNWTNIYGSGFDAGKDAVKDLTKSDSDSSTPSAASASGTVTTTAQKPGTVSARELIAQL